MISKTPEASLDGSTDRIQHKLRRTYNQPMRFLIYSAMAFLALELDAQNAMAPTGTLRAAFLGDNPALGRVDAKTGAVTGPVADLVQELARKVGVPYELIPAKGARDIIERLNAHTADLGFMAYNAGRAQEVDFSHAWLLMPNTYIVRADSPIRASADADKAGVLIAAVKDDTQDVYLRSHLTNAKIKQLPAMPAVEDVEKMLASGEAAAFAANKQRLMEIGDKFPSLRVVPDSYFMAEQSMAVAKGSIDMAMLNGLLNEALAADVVKASIVRAGLRGVEAAPVKR